MTTYEQHIQEYATKDLLNHLVVLGIALESYERYGKEYNEKIELIKRVQAEVLRRLGEEEK